MVWPKTSLRCHLSRYGVVLRKNTHHDLMVACGASICRLLLAVELLFVCGYCYVFFCVSGSAGGRDLKAHAITQFMHRPSMQKALLGPTAANYSDSDSNYNLNSATAANYSDSDSNYNLNSAGSTTTTANYSDSNSNLGSTANSESKSNWS
jgi:hypothetical protein